MVSALIVSTIPLVVTVIPAVNVMATPIEVVNVGAVLAAVPYSKPEAPVTVANAAVEDEPETISEFVDAKLVCPVPPPATTTVPNVRSAPVPLEISATPDVADGDNHVGVGVAVDTTITAPRDPMDSFDIVAYDVVEA